MSGHKLNRDTVLFWADPKMPMHVAFYVPGYGKENDAMEAAVYVLLDAVIGEVDAMNCIESVEFHDLSQVESDARPLREMAALIDSKLSR